MWFQIIGVFILISAVISLIYMLTKGKVFGPIPVTFRSNPLYYLIALASHILGILFILYWLNLVNVLAPISGAWPDLIPQPPDSATTIGSATAQGCPAASDLNYGYNEGVPIRIGGGSTSGMSRAEEFLRGLGNRAGSRITFERRGYILKNGSALDFYAIKQQESVELIIYFDYYSYEQPQAPAGLICWEELSFVGP